MAKLQGSIYENAMERTQLEIKASLFESLGREIKVINDKYDGREADEIEAKILKATDEKENLAGHVGHINKSLKKLDDLRIHLDSARSEITAGTAAGFDEKLENINNLVGSAVLDQNNLIGLKGRGSWAPRYVFLSAGSMEHTLASDFLGTDYEIELNDNTTQTPEFSARTLEGTSFDSITVTSLSDNAIQYNDGTNNFTGIINRGGLQVLNAWAYNDFATTSDQTTATADIDAGMQHIRKTELALRTARAVINGMVNKTGSELKNLASEFSNSVAEEKSAREAEISAVSLRHELTLTSVSLTSKNQVAFIKNLFLTPPLSEKRGIFKIING